MSMTSWLNLLDHSHSSPQEVFAKGVVVVVVVVMVVVLVVVDVDADVTSSLPLSEVSLLVSSDKNKTDTIFNNLKNSK